MKRKTKIMLLAIAFLCGLILLPEGAQATLIKIQIEAVVDSVEDTGNYLEGNIRVGDIITGFYVYESTTPDSSPLDPAQGNYWHYAPPAGITLTVGGFDFMTDPLNVALHVAIRNDIPEDTYALVSFDNLPLSNGAPVDSIWWQLKDNTGNALPSDALLTIPPIIGLWHGNVLAIEADRRYGIKAHVTSAIPEPASIILVTMGALFLRKTT